MTLTLITLSGCDDNTKLVVELTSDERALLERIGDLSERKSEYSCQPRMRVADAHELCAACKPGGTCLDDYADDDGQDCSTAIAERRQPAQEGTATP